MFAQATGLSVRCAILCGMFMANVSQGQTVRLDLETQLSSQTGSEHCTRNFHKSLRSLTATYNYNRARRQRLRPADVCAGHGAVCALSLCIPRTSLSSHASPLHSCYLIVFTPLPRALVYMSWFQCPESLSSAVSVPESVGSCLTVFSHVSARVPMNVNVTVPAHAPGLVPSC